MRSFSRVTTTPPSTQIYALIAKLSNNFTIFLTPCHFLPAKNKICKPARKLYSPD